MGRGLPQVARPILVLLLITASCAPTTGTAAPSPTPSATSEFDALRSRGTVLVSIRVEAPPPGSPAGDPAHAQKRAFETAVATLVVQRILGPAARAELRSTGQDRLGPVERGEADLGMAVAGTSGPEAVALSKPYARAGIVLAAPAASGVKQVEDLRGKTIAVAMDELGAREAADRYLKARGVEATLQMGQGVRGAANLVSSGTAVAVIGDRIGVLVIEKEKPGSLQVIAEVDPRSFVIGMRRSSPQLLAEVDKALQALLDSGEIAKAAAQTGFPFEPAR